MTPSVPNPHKCIDLARFERGMPMLGWAVVSDLPGAQRRRVCETRFLPNWHSG
jgi:hypothetical protein